MTLYIPKIEECVEFAKLIGASDILEVPIIPESLNYNQCHENCKESPITGYFFTRDSHGLFHAFKHSILYQNEKYVDPSPVLGNHNHRVFAFPSQYTSEILTFDGLNLFENTEKANTALFYIYGLIDPRNDEVFYIGKGKDNRCLEHFLDHALNRGNTRKNAKIKKLKKLGYAPKIEFFAQNIEDEELAYKIEEALILKYGRIGKEPNGILTNECLGKNPPNHKGKSYLEIYGSKEKATEQVEKRRRKQIEMGGFGPKKHAPESKVKISNSLEQIWDNLYTSEKELLQICKEFCEYFDNKISCAKWKRWAAKNNVCAAFWTTKTKHRLEGKSLKEYLLSLESVYISNRETDHRWYHDPETNHSVRFYGWELEHCFATIPNGYIRGRGKIIKKQRSRAT